MTTIKVIETPLSDRSIVFDVVARDDQSGDLFRFPCVSERDANRFAEELARLINEHVMGDARVAF